MPAPHLQALLWKLEYLLASEESGCVSWTMAQILQFPQRNKGRVRKSESHGAGGFIALVQMDCDTSKVVRFDQRKVERVSDGTIVMFLALAMFEQADEEMRKAVVRRTEVYSYLGDKPASRCTSQDYRKVRLRLMPILPQDGTIGCERDYVTERPHSLTPREALPTHKPCAPA